MSKSHIEQGNISQIQLPSMPRFNSTLLLIQTIKNIESHNSFPFLDKHVHSLNQSDEQDQEVSIEAMLRNPQNSRRRRTGCTCKKTNCIKMYCECFSSGKMCTPQCACFSCYNLQQYQDIVQQAKLQTKVKANHKGCHCKKTLCQKKYCECYNLGINCSQACKCTNCNNKQLVKQYEIQELSELYQ